MTPPAGDTKFPEALTHVLAYEGGYVNNPKDPGGATNYGITQKVYNQWRGDPAAQAVFGRGNRALPPQDVKLIGSAEVRAIYKREYWDKSRAAALSWPLALVHFDTAVNMGVGQANTILARTGENVDAYLADRQNVYNKIVAAHPDSAAFLKGWLSRVSSLKRTSAAANLAIGGTTLLLALVVGAFLLLKGRG